MRRLNPTTLALLAAGIIILVLAVLLFRSGSSGPSDEDRLTGNEGMTSREQSPEDRCGSQRTYDVIKRELFRQAAETRGSDQAAFDRLSAYASVRMENPVRKAEDEELGTLRCSGRLSLDLPPGVAVVGGRRTLSATIDYVLQAAADNSGDVVVLEGADPIIVPLATLARTGNNMPAPVAPPSPADPAIGEAGEVAPPNAVPAPGSPASPQAPMPQPAPQEVESEPGANRADARPSFNCRYARSRGEIAVCSDGGLAALDRQMSTQYFAAVRNADAGQREQLRRTRNRFLAYRDRCRSDVCIADAYRGRMAEIRDIMAR